MFKSTWRVAATCFLGLLLLAGGTICAQQFDPTPEDQKSAQVVCQLVHRFHISQKKIDDNMWISWANHGAAPRPANAVMSQAPRYRGSVFICQPPER